MNQKDFEPLKLERGLLTERPSSEQVPTIKSPAWVASSASTLSKSRSESSTLLQDTGRQRGDEMSEFRGEGSAQ